MFLQNYAPTRVLTIAVVKNSLLNKEMRRRDSSEASHIEEVNAADLRGVIKIRAQRGEGLEANPYWGRPSLAIL